jgi:membrane protease YdiL (CAAX protease family)
MIAGAFEASSLPHATRPVAILALLAVIVGLRRIAVAAGVTDAVTVGIGFGIGLLILGVAGGWRPQAEGRRAVVLGVSGGVAIVGLAMLTRSGGLPSLAPSAPFVPWAVATILVGTAEEAVLRGALFDALGRLTSVGVVGAVVITAAVFALIHVPLYGWQVVPLDFGVGLWLAGFRLATGGIAASAIAHSVADLSTWWL